MAGPLGSAPGIMVGVGVGTAASAAIEPLIEPGKQEAWAANPNKVLDAGLLARLVAQGGVTLGTAHAQALRHGYASDKVDALVYLAQTVPGVSEALTLYRREGAAGRDFSALFDHALVKAGLDPRYAPMLLELVQNLLSPSEVAGAVQQGHLANPSILPDLATNVTPAPGATAPATPDGQPPTVVPLTQIGIDPVAEAAGSGIEFDRLQVLANLAGLPPGQHELLEMWNRGLIDEASVDAGIREGHTKTKWIGPFKRLRWSVLSHLQYVEARVRGWITNAEMYAGGALTGYTKAQLDLLHSTHGRPLSFRDVARAIRRGAVRLDPTADYTGANPIGANGEKVAPIPDALFRALQQSNIQQQWYDMARVMAVNYPSLFMLNRIVKDDPSYIPRAVTILNYAAYEPIDITAIEAFWNKQAGIAAGGAGGAGGAGAGSSATKSATSSAVRAIKKAYVQGNTTQADATGELTTLGEDPATFPALFTAWNVERTAYLQGLSNTQIRNRYRNQGISEADALALLEERGLDAATATAYLTG